MTKHRQRTYRHKKRGGSGAPNPSSYSSAATYGSAVNGTTDAQYNRVFNQSSTPVQHGNTIVGLQGQVAGRIRKSRRHSRRHHRGGMWGQMLV